jgi:hypothetical protein
LRDAGLSAHWVLRRHACGDWGEGPYEAGIANERALIIGGEIASHYTVGSNTACSVFTAGDRLLTAIVADADLPILFSAPMGEVEETLCREAGAVFLAEHGVRPVEERSLTKSDETTVGQESSPSAGIP